MGCEIFSMWQNLGRTFPVIRKLYSSSYGRRKFLVLQENTSWTSSQQWSARSWRWRWCLSRTWGTWWSRSFTTWWTGSSAEAATSNRSPSAPFWSLIGHAVIWLQSMWNIFDIIFIWNRWRQNLSTSWTASCQREKEMKRTESSSTACEWEDTHTNKQISRCSPLWAERLLRKC